MLGRLWAVGAVAAVLVAGCSTTTPPAPSTTGTPDNDFVTALAQVPAPDGDIKGFVNVGFANADAMQSLVGFAEQPSTRPDYLWSNRAVLDMLPPMIATANFTPKDIDHVVWQQSNTRLAYGGVIAGASAQQWEDLSQGLTFGQWTQEGDGWVSRFGGLLRFTDGSIVLTRKDHPEEAGPAVPNRAADYAPLQSLLPCLGNPHLVEVSVSREMATSLAVSIDAAGTPTVHACLVGPGDPQQVAKELAPSGKHLRVKSVSVEGNVVRAELEPTTSDAAKAVLAALAVRAELAFPGF